MKGARVGRRCLLGVTTSVIVALGLGCTRGERPPAAEKDPQPVAPEQAAAALPEDDGSGPASAPEVTESDPPQVAPEQVTAALPDDEGPTPSRDFVMATLPLLWPLTMEVEERLREQPDVDLLEGDLARQGAPELTWRATVAGFKVSGDTAMDFVMTGRRIGLKPSVNARFLALMADLAPNHLRESTTRLRRVQLEVRRATDADAPPLALAFLAWVAPEEGAPTVAWPSVGAFESLDGLRATLHLFSGIKVVRAIGTHDRVLREDPYIGRSVVRYNWSLWTWVPVLAETVFSGAFTLPPWDLDYSEGEDLQGFGTLAGHVAVAMPVPVRRSADHVHHLLATADDFEPILCRALESPADGCEDPSVRRQVVALALALEGVLGIMRDPVRLMPFILEASGQLLMCLPPGVVALHKTYELALIAEELLADRALLVRFAEQADPERRQRLLAGAAVPEHFALTFKKRALETALDLEHPTAFEVEIRGRHASAEVVERVRFQVPESSGPGAP